MIKISLLKPIINLSLTTFDSSENFTVNFSATGDQVITNQCQVLRNLDNVIIFDEKIVAPYFSLNHIIPANSLENGMVYKIRISTFNSNGDMSPWSDYVLISCYSSPVIDITNVTNNGTINGQNYTFQGSYNQAENNLLQFYKYILYDSNNTEIGTSGLLYDGLLQYTYSGFFNNENYSIELQTTTQHNVTSTIRKNFTVKYIESDFTTFMELTNNPDEASIDVQIIAIRTQGQISSGTATIENNDYANLLNGVVTFDNAHGLQLKKTDWVTQMWVKNLINDKTILTLYGENNVIFKLSYKNGQFSLYKYINDIVFSRYVSNVINPTIDNEVYIYILSVNDRIDLQCEIIN